MAIINTGLLSKDVRSEFFNRFEGVDKAAKHQRIAMRIASNKDSESYRWLGTVPRLREWGTGRLAKGLRSESYDIINQKYEATIEVDRDELDDDQTGQIRIRIQELAVAAGIHKDFLISQLLKNGATAGFNSYDGVTFFSNAHVSGKSGNQDNDLTYNVALPTDPTSSEFKKSLQQAIAQMLEFKDDQGDPMLGMDEQNLIVVVPPRLLFPAREAIGAAVINNTTNTDQGIADVMVMPELAGQNDRWYLAKTDGVVRPFVFQDRAPMEVKSMAEGSDEEFLREKYYYGVRARYAMTYGYWQYCVRTILN